MKTPDHSFAELLVNTQRLLDVAHSLAAENAALKLELADTRNHADLLQQRLAITRSRIEDLMQKLPVTSS